MHLDHTCLTRLIHPPPKDAVLLHQELGSKASVVVLLYIGVHSPRIGCEAYRDGFCEGEGRRI